MRVYLDHNATTPVDPRVCEAVAAAMTELRGNPSSIHREGRQARRVIDDARRSVADLVGGSTDEIIFTSGGTEADLLGIVGLARVGRRNGHPPVVISPSIEHPAVAGALELLAAEGFCGQQLSVDSTGLVQLEAFDTLCAAGAALAVVGLANHELGVIQDLPEITEIARRHGVPVMCDAVQAAGKLHVNVAQLGVDGLAISSHKLYGPTGVGALWVRRTLPIEPLASGGHHESGRRPGTENVIGIKGFGVAAGVVARDCLAGQPAVAALRDRLEVGLVALGARVHGAGAARLANTVSVGFPGLPGDLVVQGLDLAGVAASTGAACTSGTVRPSEVLLALGLSAADASQAVRFSLGIGTTSDEIDHTLGLLPAILSRVHGFV